MRNGFATRLDVSPDELILRTGARAALKVVAHWTDGSTRDVTEWTLFDSGSAEVAAVDKAGRVTPAGPDGPRRGFAARTGP